MSQRLLVDDELETIRSLGINKAVDIALSPFADIYGTSACDSDQSLLTDDWYREGDCALSFMDFSIACTIISLVRNDALDARFTEMALRSLEVFGNVTLQTEWDDKADDEERWFIHDGTILLVKHFRFARKAYEAFSLLLHPSECVSRAP